MLFAHHGQLILASVGGHILEVVFSWQPKREWPKDLPDYAIRALEEKQVDAVIVRMELREVSAVSVPSNPDALSFERSIMGAGAILTRLENVCMRLEALERAGNKSKDGNDKAHDQADDDKGDDTEESCDDKRDDSDSEESAPATADTLDDPDAKDEEDEKKGPKMPAKAPSTQTTPTYQNKTAPEETYDVRRLAACAVAIFQEMTAAKR
jgi:hypothetical protein